MATIRTWIPNGTKRFAHRSCSQWSSSRFSRYLISSWRMSRWRSHDGIEQSTCITAPRRARIINHVRLTWSHIWRCMRVPNTVSTTKSQRPVSLSLYAYSSVPWFLCSTASAFLPYWFSMLWIAPRSPTSIDCLRCTVIVWQCSCWDSWARSRSLHWASCSGKAQTSKCLVIRLIQSRCRMMWSCRITRSKISLGLIWFWRRRYSSSP